MGTFPTYCFNL